MAEDPSPDEVVLAIGLASRSKGTERRVRPDRRSGVDRRQTRTAVPYERRSASERRQVVRRKIDQQEGPTLLEKARTRLGRLRRGRPGTVIIPPMDFAERAARNEEVFRDVNKRIEEGAEQHSVSAALPFHCECGRVACVETIDIRPARYEAVVRKRYHFVVIPGHEEPQIEQVVERESDFLVVEKIGEAREQIDRDHPQQHHHG